MTKVYFIQHCCFIIEFEDKYLIFDYFDKDSLGNSVSFYGSLPKIDPQKKVYFFASHVHKDHYTNKIFNLLPQNDTYFVLSKDIKQGLSFFSKNNISSNLKKKIKFISADDKLTLNDIKVETLKSNEVGVAFIVNCNGQDIYYAGDLNWWNAEGRGELYGEQYGREYKRALRHILNRHFDLGFVLLDSRLTENGYFLGLDYFIKNVDCSNIFPMGLWEDFKWIERFKDRPDISTLKDRVVDIFQDNMLFEIED